MIPHSCPWESPGFFRNCLACITEMKAGLPKSEVKRNVMSTEDDVALNPLHRLKAKLQGRMETNEKHRDRHPYAEVRSAAGHRVEAYRLAISEVDEALKEVALAQVDRVVAKRRP